MPRFHLGSNAKSKEEAAVRRLVCLAAKENAADEAAGSHAKAKEAAGAEEIADSLPFSARESTLKMNRLKARSMDRKPNQQIGSQINRLKAISKDWMLDHHIEGQINRSVKKGDIKPAQFGSTKTASSGSSKPAGNDKSSLSSETGSSKTVTSKLSDRDVLVAQMPTKAHTDMTRPSRARLKESRVTDVSHEVQGRDVQDLLKEKAPKPIKKVPMIPNIRIISLSEPTLKAQVGGGDR